MEQSNSYLFSLGRNMVPQKTLMSGRKLLEMIPGHGKTLLSMLSIRVLFRTPLLMKSRYFNKFERFQPHPDYPQVDASIRGSSGPVRIGYYNTITDTSRAFIRACMNVGIPFTHDFHGTLSTIGVSRVSALSDLILFKLLIII